MKLSINQDRKKHKFTPSTEEVFNLELTVPNGMSQYSYKTAQKHLHWFQN